MSVYEKIEALGIKIPPVTAPVAAFLPFLSTVGNSRCEITPTRTDANWTRICGCCAGGKTSIILFIVEGALDV